jgi:chemotaxis protein CheX
MQVAETDICEVVAGIWSSVLGLDIRRGAEPAPSREGSGFLTGCVQITGLWEGAVTLDCSAALARRTAAIMFGLEPDAASIAEIHDALGELTNMTGGNIKTLLPGPCQLSLPAVVEGTDYRVIVPGSHVVTQLAFECQGEPVKVTLLKGQKTAHAEAAKTLVAARLGGKS